jgi:hypothetical protein
MRSSFLASITTLAASAVTSLLEFREVYATRSATDVQLEVSHIITDVKFHIRAPVDSISGAPKFDVCCDSQ